MTKPETVPTRLHEIFHYDHLTGDLFRKYGIHAGKPQKTISNGYFVVHVDGKNIRVHRIAWAMHHGYWPKCDIDHIDGNPLNNAIQNLRLASKNANAHNRRATKSRGEAPKGVSWRKDKNLFRASIYLNSKRISLGYFKTEDEAAHAYNRAAIQYHGEFACLNPIGR